MTAVSCRRRPRTVACRVRWWRCAGRAGATYNRVMSEPANGREPGVPEGEDELPKAPTPALVEATVRLLKGFADPTRLRLLWLLRGGEVGVQVLVEALGMSQSAVSHQLRLLRDARLVAARRSGRRVYYRLSDEHVRSLLENAVSHGDEVT